MDEHMPVCLYTENHHVITTSIKLVIIVSVTSLLIHFKIVQNVQINYHCRLSLKSHFVFLFFIFLFYSFSSVEIYNSVKYLDNKKAN